MQTQVSLQPCESGTWILQAPRTGPRKICRHGQLISLHNVNSSQVPVVLKTYHRWRAPCHSRRNCPLWQRAAEPLQNGHSGTQKMMHSCSLAKTCSATTSLGASFDWTMLVAMDQWFPWSTRSSKESPSSQFANSLKVKLVKYDQVYLQWLYGWAGYTAERMPSMRQSSVVTHTYLLWSRQNGRCFDTRVQCRP